MVQTVPRPSGSIESNGSDICVEKEHVVDLYKHSEYAQIKGCHMLDNEEILGNPEPVLRY